MNKIVYTVKLIYLILNNFTYKTAKEYIKLKSDFKDEDNRSFCLMELMSILPFNRKFDKLFEDLLTLKFALYKYNDLLPKYYYIRLKRNNIMQYVPLYESGDSYSISSDKLVEFLKQHKSFDVRASFFNTDYSIDSYKYDGENFFKNNNKITYEGILNCFDNLKQNYIVTEHIEENLKYLNVIVLNEMGSEPQILETYTNNQEDFSYNHKKLYHDILNISRDFPEIEYMNFHLAANSKEYKILDIQTGKDLIYRNAGNQYLNKFIERKIQVKKKENCFCNKCRIIKKYIFAYIAHRKGFEDFMYKNWLRGKFEDFKNTDTPLRDKLWAHRKGFYSYRIKQYGITKENYKDFLSDYEYKRLRPLNNEYRKWLWDKISLYYVLRKYEAVLPEYYFHLCPRDDKMFYFNISTKESQYENSIQGIIGLLMSKKKLALKPTIGSHGNGFYKLEYSNNVFFINDKEYHVDDFIQFIKELNNYYILTEYIEMHSSLKAIYDNVACTIRIMVINRNGYDPVIENCYFRIATKKTGQTDNIFSGGIFARVNIDTGEFGDSEIIENHVMKPCLQHPDTHTKIKGVLPYWKDIKEQVGEICKYISPIEYLGFDIVITDIGFKILEINTHQDLHRYPEYSKNVKNYFNQKISYKSGRN